MINTGAVSEEGLRGPVTILHFWVINTVQRQQRLDLQPVTSLHFWVINTPIEAIPKGQGPVTSLHFWVINTRLREGEWVPVLSLAYISG